MNKIFFMVLLFSLFNGFYAQGNCNYEFEKKCKSFILTFNTLETKIMIKKKHVKIDSKSFEYDSVFEKVYLFGINYDYFRITNPEKGAVLLILESVDNDSNNCALRRVAINMTDGKMGLEFISNGMVENSTIEW